MIFNRKYQHALHRMIDRCTVIEVYGIGKLTRTF